MNDPKRDDTHTEQHGKGDNVGTQVNEAPPAEVEVNVETPADRQGQAERTVDRMDRK